MKEFIPFCTYNTGAVDISNAKSVYLVSALGSFSGSFGAITVGANQTLNPSLPIKFDSTISGSENTLFYYIE